MQGYVQIRPRFVFLPRIKKLAGFGDLENGIASMKSACCPCSLDELELLVVAIRTRNYELPGQDVSTTLDGMATCPSGTS